MNAPAALRSAPLPSQLLGSAREHARLYDNEGRPGTAAMIRSLVFEVENLRADARQADHARDQAQADKNIANLRASTLLIVAEKIAPILDEEIETRKQSCVEEYWAPLQSLSDELHAAMRLVRG